MYCKASDCFKCPYPDCINPAPLQIRTYTRAQKDRDNARRKEKREAYKAAGLCPICGRKRNNPRWLKCGHCRHIGRVAAEKVRRKRGKLPKCLLDGVDRCTHCGKNAPAAGYQLCPKCLDDARTALAKTPSHTGKGCVTHFADFNESFWKEQKQPECKDG